MKKIFLLMFIVTPTIFANFIPGTLPTEVPRHSSYPYITGDTFRAHADVIFENPTEPFNPNDVQHGSIVFVKRNFLDLFFKVHHPHIKHPYILITHNADEEINEVEKPYIEDEKIIVWFAQNVNLSHEKLIPLPLGIANKYWQHGDIDLINLMRNKIQNGEYKKNKFMYVNFNVNTCPGTRGEVLKMLIKQPYCYQGERKPFAKYLEDLATSYFVASPRGNGIDCHRTWEAILMGSIPVIETSHLDYIFKDLPVLIINDWSCVTKEFLEYQYEQMQQKTYNWDKLYAQYWIDLIDSYKP